MRETTSALWAPILAWLLTVGIVLALGFVIAGGVIEDVLTLFNLDSDTASDETARLLLGVLMAFGIGGIFVLPVKYFWEEAKGQTDVSNERAADTHKRIFSNRDRYYVPLMIRLESMRQAARKMLRQNAWGREQNEWLEYSRQFLFRTALFRSAYEAARASGVDFIFVSNGMTKRVRRRIRSVNRELSRVLDRDEPLRDALSQTVRKPGISSDVTLDQLQATECDYAMFREALAGGEEALTEEEEEVISNGSNLAPQREAAVSARMSILRRFEELSYLEVQRLWLLADGAFDEVARALEEIDVDLMGHDKEVELLKEARKTCMKGSGWWVETGVQRGYAVVVISSVRGLGAQQDEPSITAVRPRRLRGSLTECVRTRGFDDSGVAVLVVPDTELPAPSEQQLKVKVESRDGRRWVELSQERPEAAGSEPPQI